MKIVEIGTLEAKTNLTALLNQVLEGESFYLTRRGKRIAELRPLAPPTRSPRAGFAKGTFTYIAPDFDAPLDDFADYSVILPELPSGPGQELDRSGTLG